MAVRLSDELLSSLTPATSFYQVVPFSWDEDPARIMAYDTCGQEHPVGVTAAVFVVLAAAAAAVVVVAVVIALLSAAASTWKDTRTIVQSPKDNWTV